MMKKLFLFLFFVPALSFAQEFQTGSNSIGTDSLWLKFLQFKASSSLTSAINIYQDEVSENLEIENPVDVWGRLEAGAIMIPQDGAVDAGALLNIHTAYDDFNIDTAGRISSGRLRIRGVMPNAGVVSCFWRTMANGTAIVNTASETEFSDSIAIAAGAVEANGTIRFRTYLRVGHTNASPTATIRLKYNAEVLADAIFAPIAVSGSNVPFYIDWTVSVISNTTTRTSVLATYYNGSTFQSGASLDDATLATTDFTDAGRFAFSVQWSSASGANTITMQQITADYSDAP